MLARGSAGSPLPAAGVRGDDSAHGLSRRSHTKAEVARPTNSFRVGDEVTRLKLDRENNEPPHVVSYKVEVRKSFSRRAKARSKAAWFFRLD